MRQCSRLGNEVEKRRGLDLKKIKPSFLLRI